MPRCWQELTWKGPKPPQTHWELLKYKASAWSRSVECHLHPFYQHDLSFAAETSISYVTAVIKKYTKHIFRRRISTKWKSMSCKGDKLLKLFFVNIIISNLFTFNILSQVDTEYTVILNRIYD